MSTTILGANGKIGTILATFAQRTGLNWRTSARSGVADMIWSGTFDDPQTSNIFQHGGTLINMIGATSGSDAHLHDINVRFVRDLLIKAAQNGVAHVVLASSAAVYGAGTGRPFQETDSPDPITPYGRSKAEMERIATRFTAKNAPSITLLRIGNIAGADALTTAAKRHISQGKPMPLHHFKDGTTPTRSYIGPYDLFRAIRSLNTPHGGPPRIINIAHPQPVTLDAMLTAYKAHTLPDLEWTPKDAPNGILPIVTLSADKMQTCAALQNYSDPADAFAAQVAEVQTP